MPLEPRNLYNKYNTDNVHSRAVISGVLNFLQNKIFITNVFDNNKQEVINIPFLYGMSTDERFMQDYFVTFNECVHPKIADGNYDVIPRGHIVLKTKKVEPEKITQRFERAFYYKEKNGKLIKYSSYVYLLPVLLTFDVEVKCDTLLNCFKIEQELYKSLYKVGVFHIHYENMRLPCYIGFADEFEREENLEYSFSDTNQISLKFSLEVETYLPVFDLQTEMEASKSITTFDIIENVPIDWKVEKNFETIEFLNISDNDVFYPGSIYEVKFNYTGNIHYIDLIVSDNLFKVEKQLVNLPLYLKIPKDDSKQKVVISDDVTPVKEANIFVKTDVSGKVTECVVLDGGFGYTGNCQIQFVKTSGSFTPAVLTPIVVDGSIVSVNIDGQGNGYYQTLMVPQTIKIQDSLLNDVFDLKNVYFYFYG